MAPFAAADEYRAGPSITATPPGVEAMPGAAPAMGAEAATADQRPGADAGSAEAAWLFPPAVSPAAEAPAAPRTQDFGEQHAFGGHFAAAGHAGYGFREERVTDTDLAQGFGRDQMDAARAEAVAARANELRQVARKRLRTQLIVGAISLVVLGSGGYYAYSEFLAPKPVLPRRIIFPRPPGAPNLQPGFAGAIEPQALRQGQQANALPVPGAPAFVPPPGVPLGVPTQASPVPAVPANPGAPGIPGVPPLLNMPAPPGGQQPGPGLPLPNLPSPLAPNPVAPNPGAPNIGVPNLGVPNPGVPNPGTQLGGVAPQPAAPHPAMAPPAGDVSASLARIEDDLSAQKAILTDIRSRLAVLEAHGGKDSRAATPPGPMLSDLLGKDDMASKDDLPGKADMPGKADSTAKADLPGRSDDGGLPDVVLQLREAANGLARDPGAEADTRPSPDRSLSVTAEAPPASGTPAPPAPYSVLPPPPTVKRPPVQTALATPASIPNSPRPTAARTTISYNLRAAFPGGALVARSDQAADSAKLMQVRVGDMLLGQGQVRAIEQRGDAWVVVTERGEIR